MASASATPTSIPGAHPALAHISAKDQGGLVAVLATLAWTFVAVAFIIRVYVRYKTGPWKRDDNFLAVATVGYWKIKSILVPILTNPVFILRADLHCVLSRQ